MINKIKLYIGIEDSDSDELLFDIVEDVEAFICNYVNEASVNESLKWIVKELSIARYNRLGSEGLSSESIDARTNQFNDYLSEYKPYLDKYISDNKAKGFRLL